jgi:hypothetical protein
MTTKGFKEGRKRISALKTRSDHKPKGKTIPSAPKIGWIFTPAEKQLPTWEEMQKDFQKRKPNAE